MNISIGVAVFIFGVGLIFLREDKKIAAIMFAMSGLNMALAF